MQTPKTLTVNVMSYRYGHLAAHCVETLLGQSRAPDVIRLFDDGAGDCRHLSSFYPEVEYVLREKNLGIIDNFNDALSRTDTDRVLFLGADNWLRADAVELLMGRDTDIVTYDIMVTGEYRDEIRNRHPDELSDVWGDLYWNRAGKHHGSIMYRTDLGKQVGYQRGGKSKYSEEDKSLWDRMVEAGASVEHVPEALLYYRRHNENFYAYQGMSKSRTSLVARLLSRL